MWALQDRSMTPDTITSRIASTLAEEYICHPPTAELSSITVPGIERTTSVEVVHSIVTIAASAIVPPDWTMLHTQSNACEIALRIMDVLQKQNRLISCESVVFDIPTETIQAVLRKEASLSTQQAAYHPPIYFGPFETLCEVKQREFAVSSAASKLPVLATWHLASCIAVVGFDKETKVGFLFHIDAAAYVDSAIDKLTSQLPGKKHTFEYLLIGGSSNHEGRTKERVEGYFQQANSDTVRFKRRELPTTEEIPLSDFMADTYWSRSVRLARSVVIDLRKEDPLSDCNGYEPEINPYSTQHIETPPLTSLRMKCVLRL